MSKAKLPVPTPEEIDRLDSIQIMAEILVEMNGHSVDHWDAIRVLSVPAHDEAGRHCLRYGPCICGKAGVEISSIPFAEDPDHFRRVRTNGLLKRCQGKPQNI